MVQVTFFVLQSTDDTPLLPLVCQQAAQHYRQQKNVFIYADNQESCHQLDEILWSFEPDSFVPHNLVGEGPKQGSPVEISWQPPKNRRQVLINYASTMPQFCHQFAHVIDFVPVDETRKQLARDRYRQYKSSGFTITTQNITE